VASWARSLFGVIIFGGVVMMKRGRAALLFAPAASGCGQTPCGPAHPPPPPHLSHHRSQLAGADPNKLRAMITKCVGWQGSWGVGCCRSVQGGTDSPHTRGLRSRAPGGTRRLSLLCRASASPSNPKPTPRNHHLATNARPKQGGQHGASLWHRSEGGG